MAHLIHQSVLSQDILYTVVATSLSPRFGPSEKGSLGRAWNLGASTAWELADITDAGRGRSNWSICRMDGWMEH